MATERPVSLRDIAAALGISEATVSLALNNRPTSARTRERILKYAAEVGYSPNPLARGLATNRTLTIGLVCPDTENPYYGSFVRGINDHAEAAGYSLFLALSGYDAKREATLIQALVDRKVDGIIVLPLDLPRNDRIDINRITRLGVPIIFGSSFYEGFEPRTVMSDYEGGSYALTHHMLQHGHRSLWYLVTEDASAPVAAMRIDGYRRAYHEAELEPEATWIISCEGRNSAEAAYQRTRELLRSRVRPDGILSMNDYMAFGVLRALHELQIEVPDEVSVAGYDDVFYASITNTSLTTVRQDIDAISARCVRRLLRAIEEPTSSGGLDLIATQLVVRNSTR